MHILVAIPAYNEEGSITDVIAQVREHLPTADILVVDGYSTDRTFKLASGAGAHVVRVPSTYAIAGAVETAFLYAYRNGFEVLARMDSDGQHHARDLARIIQAVVSGWADVAVGSRYLESDSYENTLTRAIGITLFAALVSRITGKRFTDTTSGIMAVNRDVIRYVAVHHQFDYSEVEAIVILHRAGFNVREVPVTMRQRTVGTSSFTTVRAFYYVFKGLLSVMLEVFRRVRPRGTEL